MQSKATRIPLLCASDICYTVLGRYSKRGSYVPALVPIQIDSTRRVIPPVELIQVDITFFWLHCRGPERFGDAAGLHWPRRIAFRRHKDAHNKPHPQAASYRPRDGERALYTHAQTDTTLPIPLCEFCHIITKFI